MWYDVCDMMCVGWEKLEALHISAYVIIKKNSGRPGCQGTRAIGADYIFEKVDFLFRVSDIKGRDSG